MISTGEHVLVACASGGVGSAVVQLAKRRQAVVTAIAGREMMNRFPLLPLEEAGQLSDMPLRENFVERVFAYCRWTEMLEKEPTPGGLVKFHTAHKLTLMAHSPKHYTEMGRLVAQAGKLDVAGADRRVWRHADGGPGRDGL